VISLVCCVKNDHITKPQIQENSSSISPKNASKCARIINFTCNLIEHPLRTIVKNSKATGRISKWASKLRSYELKYELTISIKGQLLANFIANFTPRTTEYADQLEGWVLNIDGASKSKGAGIRIILTTPKESIIEQSFTLGFPASNNEAEYEVVITGLQTVIILRVSGVKVRSDSSLVVNQVSSEYVTGDS